MITPEIKEMIESNPLALATINNNLTPHLIVVAFAKVTEGKIIITDNYMQTTIENLGHNNKVSLVVWNEEWKGYSIEGTASYSKDGKWKEFILSLEENKDEPCKGAIVIEVNKIIELG